MNARPFGFFGGAVVWGILIVGTSARPVEAARFAALGDLPGGAFFSAANGVSADGSVVVGRSSTAASPVFDEAFRWTTNGGMVVVGDLPGGPQISFAAGVSADGSVVIGSSVSAEGEEAYRWTSGGGMVGLGDLAGGFFDSLAYAVSADGSVVVGVGISAAGEEAFRWTSGGGMVGLGDLPGGVFWSVATGASADGSVVVGLGHSAAGEEAFRWTSGGGMVGLGDLPGGDSNSIASGVSADGSVIVGRSISAAGSEAFRWTSGGGMIGLGHLPGADSYSYATGVSANGSVVVGYGISAAVQEAFVWDSTNGMRSVREVIAPTVDAALTGWTLEIAQAISADGRTAVGYGTDPNGNLQAWLAYLPDQILWSPNASGFWDTENNWTGPFQPGPTDDVVIDPTAPATVTASAAPQTIRSLSIGGSITARVTLALNNIYNGDLTATSGATLAHNGELLLGAGRVLSAATVASSGVIRGTGTVNANLTNNSNGEVRVAAGETLIVSGASHANAGKVEVIGGSLETIGGVVNAASTGLITVRSATLRFQNGLTNGGSLLITAGVNDVSGDITNSSGGKILVSSGAAATFYDDIVQNGVLQVLKAGTTTSVATFAGSFTGSGGSTGGGDIFFLGDLRPGNSPASVTFANNVGLGGGTTTNIELAGATLGTQYDHITVTGQLVLDGMLSVSLLSGFSPTLGQTFDILDWGTLDGTFASLQLPTLAGGLAWNTSQLYTTGVLSVSAVAGIAGDYNNNGLVDAADYVLWRNGGPLANEVDTPGTTNSADYTAWRARFGNTSGAGAGAAEGAPSASSATPIPEPASSILIIAALTCPVAARRFPRAFFA